MVSVALPSQRRAKEAPLALSIEGRTIVVVVRVRPIYAKPQFAGFVVAFDEEPAADLLPGEAGSVSGGWWIELLGGAGDLIVGATKLTASADLWAAHNAYLRALFGAHLVLQVTATPTDKRPLAEQCEINLTPQALA